MGTSTAIEVNDLWKEYQIGRVQRRPDTFYDTVAAILARPFRRDASDSPATDESFWALRGVDFSIRPGEVVGIIGRNGAGKSTLLKVLSRITSPTRGRVRVRGRLASLLEVGTGFHPELTGRENIFLNAAVLGMTRREVLRKFDQIVAFSEVEAFIDTPVKRYSSGMQVRLAFSVAAHLDVDVLLVDEVLAVGDAAFQEKCLGRMNALSNAERAVVFVSHDVGAVSRLCTRSIVLSRGAVTFDGPVQEGLAHYYAQPMRGVVDLAEMPFEGPLKADVSPVELAFHGAISGSDATFHPDSPARVEVTSQALRDFAELDVAVVVFSRGHRLFAMFDAVPGRAMPKGRFLSRFEIPAGLLRPGPYSVGLGYARGANKEYAWCPTVAQFSVIEDWTGSRRPEAGGFFDVIGRVERVPLD